MKLQIPTSLRVLSCCAAFLICTFAYADDLPLGYWPAERTPEILDLAQTVRLAPDLSTLTPGEKRAVQELLAAGKALQRAYEDARHPQALQAFDTLQKLHVQMGQGPATQSLLDLYRLFKGPIATTPENEREAFMPVSPETPARNVYPPDATREEIDAYLAQNPEDKDDILDRLTTVRRTTPENLKMDIATLAKYPALDVLHPNLRKSLESRKTQNAAGFYAIPQSVRWASEYMEAYRHINAAARSLDTSDPDFARYLRNRARDLLSDDYESGDAAWVTGNFKHLNAQIGAYETYDDALYGAKAFMSMSVLKRDEPASRKLMDAIRGLQGIEDSLPSPQHRKVRDEISIGVYDVIADFGQSRGRNTATILPNDPLFVRRYGRTILLRENILRDPALLANTQAGWKSIVASPFAGDVNEDGEFYRALWHEIGHYMGVERDRRGHPPDVALDSLADTFEELKADLVSLYVAPALKKSGYYDEQALRSVYGSGLRRTLQTAKPRRDQPYQTMQLMQFNWMREHGAFDFEPANGKMMINYDRFAEGVSSMLEAVLGIQYEGDRAAAEAFVDRWTKWEAEPHETLAKKLRESSQFQYVIFKYSALGE